MKIVYRIPTEMYAFAEVSFEWPDEVSADQVKEKYDVLSEAFKPKSINEGIDKKTFDSFTDRYLQCEKMNSGDFESYNKMSKDQQDKIQWAKRSFKRVDARRDREDNGTWDHVGPGKGENGDWSGQD